MAVTFLPVNCDHAFMLHKQQDKKKRELALFPKAFIRSLVTLVGDMAMRLLEAVPQAIGGDLSILISPLSVLAKTCLKSLVLLIFLDGASSGTLARSLRFTKGGRI